MGNRLNKFVFGFSSIAGIFFGVVGLLSQKARVAENTTSKEKEKLPRPTERVSFSSDSKSEQISESSSRLKERRKDSRIPQEEIVPKSKIVENKGSYSGTNSSRYGGALSEFFRSYNFWGW